MNKLAEFKKQLEELKSEIVKRFHVSSIGLFGSVVRDDFTAYSDVDIIVDFVQPVGVEFIDLAEFLENKLKRNIDLVSRNGIKEKYFRNIEREIVYV